MGLHVSEGQTAKWEFTLEGFDINFRVEWLAESGDNVLVIRPSKKVQAAGVATAGLFVAPTAGTSGTIPPIQFPLPRAVCRAKPCQTSHGFRVAC